MPKDTLKELSIDVNENVTNNKKFKSNLKEFLETTNVEIETKNALTPLLKEITSDQKFDERLESEVNKKHIIALLTSMREKFVEHGYTYVYQHYKSVLTFAVQSYLRIIGIELPKENIDGKYGDETKNAVLKFQERQKLKTDSKVGLDTITKMLEIKYSTNYENTGKIDDVGKDGIKTGGEVGGKIVDVFSKDNTIHAITSYAELPTNINTNEIYKYGLYYYFSNNRVVEYAPDGKSIIRKGERSEIDTATGKWSIVNTDNRLESTNPIDNSDVIDMLDEGIFAGVQQQFKDQLLQNGQLIAGLDPIAHKRHNEKYNAYVFTYNYPNIIISSTDKKHNAKKTFGFLEPQDYLLNNGTLYLDSIYKKINSILKNNYENEQNLLKNAMYTKLYKEQILQQKFTINDIFSSSKPEDARYKINKNNIFISGYFKNFPKTTSHNKETMYIDPNEEYSTFKYNWNNPEKSTITVEFDNEGKLGDKKLVIELGQILDDTKKLINQEKLKDVIAAYIVKTTKKE